MFGLHVCGTSRVLPYVPGGLYVEIGRSFLANVDPFGLVAHTIEIAHEHRVIGPLSASIRAMAASVVSNALTVRLRTAAAVSIALAVASTPLACCMCGSFVRHGPSGYRPTEFVRVGVGSGPNAHRPA